MSQYVKVEDLMTLAKLSGVSELKPGTKYLVVLEERQPVETLERMGTLLRAAGVDAIIADCSLKFYDMSPTSFNFGHNVVSDPDPFHDEGNATNHRVSQCGPACAEPAEPWARPR